MKVHVNFDLLDKLRNASQLSEKAKTTAAGLAEKVKKSQAGPICISATIGFLSGVIIGIVLSPVKNGITIASNNQIGMKEKKAKTDKYGYDPIAEEDYEQEF